jgi:hypothetical protein
MALQLGRVVSDGIKRVATPTGGILLALLVAIQMLAQVSVNTIAVGLFPPGPAGEIEAALGITLPVSVSVAAAMFVASVVFSSIYFVVLSRALTRPAHSLSTFPSTLFTRRIGRASVTMLVGGIFIALTIMVGTIFVFVPGIFFAVSFLFFMFAVGVEDRGLVAGLKRSWGLSQGNRVKLSIFVVLAGIFGFMISTLATVVDIAGSPVVGDLILNGTMSILFIVLYGCIAAAYQQLAGTGSRESGNNEATEPLGSIS